MNLRLSISGSFVWIGILLWLPVLGQSPSELQTLTDRANAAYMARDYKKAAPLYEKICNQNPSDFFWNRLAYAAHSNGNYDLALKAYQQAKESRSYKMNSYYNISCIHAIRGEKDLAFEALEKAMSLGYANASHMKTDPDLDNLRDDPRFRLPQEPQYRSFISSSGAILEYSEVLPRDHDPQKAYPTMLAFPPGGQDKNAVNWAMSYYWGAQAAAAGWVVFSPVAPSGNWYVPKNTKALVELIDDLQGRVRLEDGRFHLVGCGNGGVTAFHLATQSPDHFQTLTTLPGYARNQATHDRLSRLGELKVTLFRGEKESNWWIEQIDKTHEGLQAAGVENSLKITPGDDQVVSSLFTDGLIVHLNQLREMSKSVEENP